MRSAHRRAGALAPPRSERADEARERVALDVLHHEVVAGLALADLEDGDDVRVVDARGEARLVEEHLDELLLVRRGAGAAA